MTRAPRPELKFFMYFLYIIKSTHKNYNYVGTTNNLNRRIMEHNSGKNKSTRHFKPFILCYKEEYKSLSEARKKEWFLKCTPQGGKLKRKILIVAGVAA